MRDEKRDGGAERAAIVRWLRHRADEWQTEEGPHDEPGPGCTCSFQCNEAITYRIVADAIEEGEHVGDEDALLAARERGQGGGG